MLTHCSNSSPCVIAAKANSGLGGRILPLNQHSVFSSSKEHFHNCEKVGILGVVPFSSCEAVTRFL